MHWIQNTVCALLFVAACEGGILRNEKRIVKRAIQKPMFCGDFNCPRFRTVHSSDEFSVRCYARMALVTTRCGGVNPQEDDYTAAYNRLESYIGGANAWMAPMNVTVPLMQSTMYDALSGSWSSNISFFTEMLPPPLPDNDQIFIESKRHFCAYVKSFHADISDHERIENVTMEFYMTLTSMQKPIVDEGLSVLASYWPTESDYNEVWIMAPWIPRSRKPRFCESSDCPKFEMIYRNRNYSLRCYKPMTVATTPAGADNPDENDFWMAFMRLVDYVNGSNTDQTQMEMTVPVVHDTIYNPDSDSTRTDTSIYLNTDNPPTPTDASVSIVHIPRHCVYVKSFWANIHTYPNKIKNKLVKLYNQLTAKRQPILMHERSFYSSYSMPYDGAYNEVSFLAPVSPAFRLVFRRGPISKRCYKRQDPSPNGDRYARVQLQVPSPAPEDYPAAFHKLESYINGSNSEQRRVDKGNPSFIIETDYDVMDPMNFTSTLIYYIRHDASTPTDQSITIVRAPKFCVYVKSFTGDVTTDPGLVHQESASLMNWLAARQRNFIHGKVFYANYVNSGQHEVWVLSD